MIVQGYVETCIWFMKKEEEDPVGGNSEYDGSVARALEMNKHQ